MSGCWFKIGAIQANALVSSGLVKLSLGIKTFCCRSLTMHIHLVIQLVIYTKFSVCRSGKLTWESRKAVIDIFIKA